MWHPVGLESPSTGVQAAVRSQAATARCEVLLNAVRSCLADARCLVYELRSTKDQDKDDLVRR